MKTKHTGPMGAQPKITVHKRYPEKLMSARVERRSPLNDRALQAPTSSKGRKK